MRRQIIIGLILWLCVIVTPGFLFAHYYLGFQFSKEFFQLVILATFFFLNFTYLFLLLLNKVGSGAAIALLLVFSLADYLYMRFYNDMDGRLQILQILIALMVITIVVRFVLKKSSRL
jgi:hypothetical protein